MSEPTRLASNNYLTEAEIITELRKLLEEAEAELSALHASHGELLEIVESWGPVAVPSIASVIARAKAL